MKQGCSEITQPAAIAYAVKTLARGDQYLFRIYRLPPELLPFLCHPGGRQLFSTGSPQIN